MSVTRFVPNRLRHLPWLLLVFALLQCSRSNQTLTDLERDPFVKPLLSADNAGKKGLPTHVIAHNNRVRRCLFRAWTGSHAPVKAVHSGFTIEGDPATTYMIVHPGKATLISDLRKDRYAGRKVGLYEIQGLRLGIRGPDGQFISTTQTDQQAEGLDQLIIQYQFVAPNTGIGYF